MIEAALTPYEMLREIDREMPYAAFDKERFVRLCVCREIVADDCRLIGEAVGAFFRSGTDA
jgi:hypothetical protein